VAWDGRLTIQEQRLSLLHSKTPLEILFHSHRDTKVVVCFGSKVILKPGCKSHQWMLCGCLEAHNWEPIIMPVNYERAGVEFGHDPTDTQSWDCRRILNQDEIRVETIRKWRPEEGPCQEKCHPEYFEWVGNQFWELWKFDKYRRWLTLIPDSQFSLEYYMAMATITVCVRCWS